MWADSEWKVAGRVRREKSEREHWDLDRDGRCIGS